MTATSAGDMEELLIDFLIDATPQEWESAEWKEWQESSNALLDAFTRGELDVPTEEGVPDPGDAALEERACSYHEEGQECEHRAAFKARKVYTEAAPSFKSILESPAAREKWIPVIREHMKQLVFDFALESTRRFHFFPSSSFFGDHTTQH